MARHGATGLLAVRLPFKLRVTEDKIRHTRDFTDFDFNFNSESRFKLAAGPGLRSIRPLPLAVVDRLRLAGVTAVGQ